MKTQTNKISFLRKNITLIFMLVLLISSLWAKHVRAQTVLWVENKETNQRKYFTLNKAISYKLVTSRFFHDGRLTSFTDSTLTLQIEGSRIAIIKFKDLAVLKKGARGRRAIGAVISSLGFITATAALASATSSIGFNSPNAGSPFNSPKLFVIGLAAIPVGIILVSRKKIDLTKSWVLKTK